MKLLLSILLIVFSNTSSTQNFFGDNADNFFDEDYSKLAPIFVGNPPKEFTIAKYYAVSGLENLLAELSQKYKNIVKLTILGVGSIGSPIYAVEISHNVAYERNITKPMFKYVANLHGDDAVGYALMVSLIQYLVYRDGHDTRITKMLANIDIWIVLIALPDDLKERKKDYIEEFDFRKLGRKRRALDEEFPHGDWVVGSRELLPETKIVSQFIKKHPFVLSGNLESGAIVASYPLDYSPGKTFDDEIFEKLALDYAEINTMMAPGNACGKFFKHGITNGYKWKNRTGMQDFNYFHSNCFELTFHLSCCKYPNSSELPLYWTANLRSMLKFIESTRIGVYGLVKDEMKNTPIVNAAISVRGKGKVIQVTKNGEYWRLLNIGVYDVTASAPRYESQTESIYVNSTHPYVYHDFILKLKPRKRCKISCLGGCK